MIIRLDECLCKECTDYRLLVASIKEFQKERGPVEYDWEDLERSSDLARQHRYPDGRPWVAPRKTRRT